MPINPYNYLARFIKAISFNLKYYLGIILKATLK